MFKVTHYFTVAFTVGSLHYSLATARGVDVSSDDLISSNVVRNATKTNGNTEVNYSNNQLNLRSSSSSPAWGNTPEEIELGFEDNPIDSIGRKENATISTSTGSQFRQTPDYSEGRVRKDMKGPTKLARFRKSQLNRMPMSFGKRTLDSPPEDMDTDVDLILDPGQVSSVEKSSHEDFSNDKDTLTRQRKAKLGRMPMAYGKRQEPDLSFQQEDDITILMPVEEIQGYDQQELHKKFGLKDRGNIENYQTLDNDNSKWGSTDFGEIEEIHKQDKEYLLDTSKQNQLASSHLNVGKQSEEDIDRENILNDFSETNKEMSIVPVEPSKQSESKAIDDDNDDDVDDDEYSDTFMREAKGSLSRMPVSFGKRTTNGEMEILVMKDRLCKDGDSVTMEEKRDTNSKYDELFQILKSKLAAVKKDDIVNINKNVQHLLDQLIAKGTSMNRLTRSKLERMPITYGKRSMDNLELIDYTNNMSKIMKRPALNRMPMAYGKRNNDQSNSRGHESEIYMIVTRSALGRMPITYGKRNTDHSDIDNVNTKRKRSALNRMPIIYGKRNTDQSELPNHVQNTYTTVKRAALNRMPMSFGKRQLDNSNFRDSTNCGYDIFKRPALHRMPMSFGKRNNENSDFREHTRSVYVVMKRPALNRMPMAFGKRNNDNSELRDYISSGNSKMKRPALNRMPMSFGKRFYNHLDHRHNLNEIMKRPALNRMPMSFGKRNDYNSQFKDYTSNIFEMMKRPALNRMPMSFGKRIPLMVKPFKLQNRPGDSLFPKSTMSGNAVLGSDEVNNLQYSSVKVSTSRNSKDSERQHSSSSVVDGSR